MHGCKFAFLSFAAAGLILASGCRTVEHNMGITTRNVIESHRETRTVTVANWPVEVYVNGRFAGTYRTNANGEVAANYSLHVRNALQTNSNLQIEFRFRQPDGSVESRMLVFTPNQLRGN